MQLCSFTWSGGTEAIGPTLARAVRTADDVGFDSIWVMDHFWQIGGPDSELQPMLEGWTTLGFMAANSQRARLGLMVGGVPYRNPGLWVKAATTLDVLSGGRAWLGIGAAWNQAEAEGLGFPWPTQGERFDMLEDTLQIANGMWQGERGSESTDQIVERFGRLAEAGVQHVIMSTADAHNPGAIELPGRDVLPQLRGVEAADPRTVAGGARR